MKKKHSKSHMKGKGILDEINKFLKQSKIISSVGNVLAPVAGAALGGLVTANPLGAAAGTAAGSSLNEYVKSLGYGKKIKGRGYSSKPLMVGRGVTFGLNGVIQKAPMSGKGNTTALGVVGNNYGSAKF